MDIQGHPSFADCIAQALLQFVVAVLCQCKQIEQLAGPHAADEAIHEAAPGLQRFVVRIRPAPYTQAQRHAIRARLEAPHKLHRK